MVDDLTTMVTCNDFEREFGHFLGRAPDVLRFVALGRTEQGDRGAAFRVDYVKPSGAIGFYYPDWVVVQRDHSGEVNWIVETKGRVREGPLPRAGLALDSLPVSHADSLR